MLAVVLPIAFVDVALFILEDALAVFHALAPLPLILTMGCDLGPHALLVAHFELTCITIFLQISFLLRLRVFPFLYH